MNAMPMMMMIMIHDTTHGSEFKQRMRTGAVGRINRR